MMTMMVTNRSIGRSNRTHQNSKRDNRKQNATNLHERPSPKSALKLPISLFSLLREEAKVFLSDSHLDYHPHSPLFTPGKRFGESVSTDR
jgi:hypothetical protein